MAYDPAKYLADPDTIRFFQSNWYWVDRFDKFYFVNDWQVKDLVTESKVEIDCDFARCLLVTSPGNYPKGWKKLETINFWTASLLLKYMRIKYFFLAGVLAVAAFLRLWHLGSVPPSLTPDEAALGYNAYSILHTARDEYGKFLPVIFKSFGDYKPGLYVYLTAPSVAALGLNEFSTRLPSALAGILSVYLIYFVIRELFPSLEIVAAFVAATNPYLIYFSRGAWEANVSLTLTLAGIYFFFEIISKQ